MPDRSRIPPRGSGPIPGFHILSILPALASTSTAVAQSSGNDGGGGLSSALLLFGFAVALLLLALIGCALLCRRRRANPEQEGLLSQRVDSLQQQLIEREKLASLGQLTAGIAHEIKNPLNFVTNFSDLSIELIDELRGTTSDEEREDILAALAQNLEKISEHGHRADEIVRSMMLHARGGNTARESADLNRLISESAHLAYHAMRAQQDGFNCTIDLELDAQLPHPAIVRQDIGRVLLNILQNAMQAVHARTLTGEPDYTPRVTVVSETAGDRVRVRIRDNGPGIPASIRAQIFEPFFTTKGVDKGTGLGLAITQDIITAEHGGSIRVEDAAEGGAEFVIELPVQAGTSVPAPAGGMS